jgi:hypothetical protein
MDRDYLGARTAVDGYGKETSLASDKIEKFLSSPDRSCPGSFSVYETIFF